MDTIFFRSLRRLDLVFHTTDIYVDECCNVLMETGGSNRWREAIFKTHPPDREDEARQRPSPRVGPDELPGRGLEPSQLRLALTSVRLSSSCYNRRKDYPQNAVIMYDGPKAGVKYEHDTKRDGRCCHTFVSLIVRRCGHHSRAHDVQRSSDSLSDETRSRPQHGGLDSAQLGTAFRLLRGSFKGPIRLNPRRRVRE